MNKNLVIAVDGPAASGKGTIAARLAREYGLPHLDTGLLYRAVGVGVLDAGGSLRVGPQSAGADPGPAAYGRGGPATVTDANLVLGRLDPRFFPAIFGPNGEAQLDVAAARAALQTLADAMGAGPGEMVLTAAGSSARQTTMTDKKPVDNVIMAIVDTWEVNGETKYTK